MKTLIHQVCFCSYYSIIGSKTKQNYGKIELIIKIISTAIEKLDSLKESALAKCLAWTKIQVQINLDYKPDAYAFKNIEEMKKIKPSLQVKLGWMKEYSALNNQQDIYTITNLNPTQKLSYSNVLHSIGKLPLESDKENNNDTIKPKISSNKIAFSDINQELLNFESPLFNIFKLEENVGQKNILPTISCFVFASLGLYSIIDYNKYECYLEAIVKGYDRANPYHTDLHAADMVQTTLLYIIYGDLQKQLHLSDIDIVALFISGAIHDYKHPGLTNNFLIATKNGIAIRYNDRSVLENYHTSESFNLLMRKKEYNIFDGLSVDEYKLIRKRIVECVLATDMTLHNKEFQFLKVRVQTYSVSKGENIDKIFENLDNVTKFNIQQEFLNVLIHAADVSNPTKPLDIYIYWAEKVVEEFFKQGDIERELGISISFLCDRHTVSLPQSQIGFIEGIVNPLFSVIVEYFPNLVFTVENININLEYFKKLKEEEKKEAC